MSKKAPSNKFPSNIRSLLSTGILDGVPVKYKTWSRQLPVMKFFEGFDLRAFQELGYEGGLHCRTSGGGSHLQTL
ncbi:hypothetical protein E2542_SST12097 [Spatholobus suberectus]|nr:hypothetical protein E2542_SST12097 [Spatholobus suberectus]